MDKNIVLMHVGKCSGTFLIHNIYKIIPKNNFIHIHHANQPINTLSPNPELLIKNRGVVKFICTFRHPIDRWVSAFNFKCNKFLTKNTPRGQWKNEKEGFQKYKTANNLAEQLYDDDGNPDENAHDFAINGCDHFKFNLNHYLCNFNKNHNVEVIRHEHINDDFLKIFNVETIKIEGQLQPNPKKNDEITLKAYNNLKRFLKQEYDLINNFASYGFISEEYKQFCCGIPKSTKIKD